MSKRIKQVITIFAALALCAFLAWLAGFDFDRRGFDVAYWSAMSVWAALMAAVFVRIE